MPGPITFTLGTLDERGMVELSAPGRDLIRAILYKWLVECDKAKAEATEWAKQMPNGKYEGQVAYWRNAGSFLVGKLSNNLPLRFNAGKYLPFIAKWPAGTMAPERWASDLFHSLAQVPPDEPPSVTTGGSGEDSNGIHGDDPVAAEQSGAVEPPPYQSEGPNDDPTTPGAPVRASAVSPGAVGPEPTGGRGRTRNKAGTPDGNARPESAATKRGSATSRSGKPGRK